MLLACYQQSYKDNQYMHIKSSYQIFHLTTQSLYYILLIFTLYETDRVTDCEVTDCEVTD